MGLLMELLFSLVAVVYLCVNSEAQLREEFYDRTCPHAESIVRDEVAKAYREDEGVAASLVRMHFHDCFVRGCDGSVLIDSTANNTAEKDSPPNNPSLRAIAFEVIDNAKAKLEQSCKGVVSCADILAFAARDSVDLAGGHDYDVPAGRRDGRVSLASEAVTNVPPPSFNVSQLTQAFANKGLTQTEMVTLSGAHTIGRSHCTSFANRLYNFDSTTSQDPSLDPTYAAKLKQQCPQGSTDPSLVVPMDPSSPNEMDSNYYEDLQVNRGLFTSDQSLWNDPATSRQVSQNAQRQLSWKQNFAAALVKMGKIDVLTGTNGEIRSNCRVIN